MDGDLDNAAVDPSGDVGPDAIGLTLDEKRCRERQKPKAEGNGASQRYGNADSRASSLSGFNLLRHLWRNRLVAAGEELDVARNNEVIGGGVTQPDRSDGSVGSDLCRRLHDVSPSR